MTRETLATVAVLLGIGSGCVRIGYDSEDRPADGGADARVPDAAREGGARDAGRADAAPTDGSADAALDDAGPADAGSADAGDGDGGPGDGGVADAGWPREEATVCGGPSTLRDVFDGLTPAEQWVDDDGGGSVTVEGGRLRLVAPASVTGRAERRSRRAFRMAGDRVMVEYVDFAGGVRAELTLRQSDASVVGITQSGPELALAFVEGGVDRTERRPWDPDGHRFWQLREAAGRIHWEVSADGRAWTSLRDEPSPSFLRVVRLHLASRNEVMDDAPPTVGFANLNVDRLVADECAADTLVDDFADGVRSPEWGGSPPDSGACRTSESGGATLFSLTAAGVARCELATARAFDLRGSAVFIRIPTLTVFEPEMAVFFGVRDEAGREWTVELANGAIVSRIGGAAITAMYDRNPFWRLRELAGSVVFESSFDGDVWGTVLAGVLGWEVDRVQPFFGVSSSGPMARPVDVQVLGYDSP